MINTTVDILLFYMQTLTTLVATVIMFCIYCYIFTTKFSRFLTNLTNKIRDNIPKQCKLYVIHIEK